MFDPKGLIYSFAHWLPNSVACPGLPVKCVVTRETFLPSLSSSSSNPSANPAAFLQTHILTPSIAIILTSHSSGPKTTVLELAGMVVFHQNFIDKNPIVGSDVILETQFS